MKKLIIILVILAFASLVSAQEEVSMYIQLGLAEDDLSVEEVGLVEGSGVNPPFENNDYSAVVNSISGKTYMVDFFFPGYVFIDSYEGESGIELLDWSSQLLYFPYYKDVDKLDVFDSEDNLVLTYDLSDYRICNFDGKCSGVENEFTCTEDCKQVVEDVAKEVKEEITIKPKVQRSKEATYIFLGLAVVALMIIILIIDKRRKKK